jgi:hypothetical protein
MRSGQTFELIFESLTDLGTDRQGRKRSKPLSLWVPPGVSSLRLTSDGPCLGAREADDEHAAFEPPDAAFGGSFDGASDGWAALIEPVHGRSRQPAMLFTPPDDCALLNGVPCPPVALLSAADQVQLGDYVVHVALFNRPALGPVPAELVGQSCPICRRRFAEGSYVYVCHQCHATALHDIPPGKAASESEDLLDCVRMCSECPACNAPIMLDEGYAHYPDLED